MRCALATGLTSRAGMEKMASLQMVDVMLPTSDARQLIVPRYAQPGKEHLVLLRQLHLHPPAQPGPLVPRPARGECLPAGRRLPDSPERPPAGLQGAWCQSSRARLEPDGWGEYSLRLYRRKRTKCDNGGK